MLPSLLRARLRYATLAATVITCGFVLLAVMRVAVAVGAGSAPARFLILVPLATAGVWWPPSFLFFAVRGESAEGFADALYNPWMLAWLIGGVTAFLTGLVMLGGRGVTLYLHGAASTAVWSVAVLFAWYWRARAKPVI